MPPAGDLAVRADVPLAARTSLRVGGHARWLVQATSVADLVAAHAWSETHAVPMVVLGGGTNVVIADAGIDALVVEMALRGLEVTDDGETVTIAAAAGEPWDGVVAAAVSHGAAGLECLSGIPGLAGGTPIQNVGAYGQDVSAVISHVSAFDRVSGTVVEVPAAACGFAYRTSRFKDADAGRFVVCAVTFRLRKGPPTTTYADIAAALDRRDAHDATVADVRAVVLDVRRAKAMVLDADDPDTRSVGSFFTNPVVTRDAAARISTVAGADAPQYVQADGRVKVPAAWLIERAGFARGSRDRAVGLSTKHTLAIVTRDGARAADVVRFAARVARAVEDRFGARLRPEPVFLGFARDGKDPDVDYLLGAHD